ncbi:hypothetical protein Tdes44962_MAKER02157 [Teratosphaeria destructans]|uniref:Uncharacterized protein n=1 Tax=Teratosphaeria destructans TaxID=418781 RepID=A0A9W7SUR4_9PEZI|nr:hypothetical protein Tdes44962_MAKER02157 [Teratosphaeria destructans]
MLAAYPLGCEPTVTVTVTAITLILLTPTTLSAPTLLALTLTLAPLAPQQNLDSQTPSSPNHSCSAHRDMVASHPPHTSKQEILFRHRAAIPAI